jgi:hypothetical protein
LNVEYANVAGIVLISCGKTQSGGVGDGNRLGCSESEGNYNFLKVKIGRIERRYRFQGDDKLIWQIEMEQV